MCAALLCAQRPHAPGATRSPAADRGVGRLGMELQPDGAAIGKRLIGERLAMRQQLRAGGQIKALKMPLIDV